MRISNSKNNDEPKAKLVLYKAVFARLQNAKGSFISLTDFLTNYLLWINTHHPDPGQAILEEFDRVSDPDTKTHDLWQCAPSCRPATCQMSPGDQNRAWRKGSSHILPGAGSALQLWSGKVELQILPGWQQSRANKNTPSISKLLRSHTEFPGTMGHQGSQAWNHGGGHCWSLSSYERRISLTGSVPAPCSSVPCEKSAHTALAVKACLFGGNSHTKCSIKMKKHYK